MFSALAVVILGGLDSVGGVILAGLAIGWVQSMTGAYLGGQFREMTPFLVVFVGLMLRPHGLFGSRTIERL